MKNRKHAALKMTLREVFDAYYDHNSITGLTYEEYDVALRHWERLSADPAVGDITDRAMASFRRKLLKEGKSPATVDRQRRIMLAILRPIGPPQCRGVKGLGILRRLPRMRPCARRPQSPGKPGRKVLPKCPAPAITEAAEARSLTLRDVCTRIYAPASLEISARTVTKLSHHCNMWEKFTSNRPLGEIATADFFAFREGGLAAPLSATTIEGAIRDIRCVFRLCMNMGFLDRLPWTGKPLRVQLKLKPTPTIEEFSAVYRLAGSPRWPLRTRRSRGDGRVRHARYWWQGLLCCGLFTALRRGDLLSLTWEDVKPDRISITQRKTSFPLEVPIHPLLHEALGRLPRNREPVFGYSGSYKQIRFWLGRMADAAGVTQFTLQGVRRLSSQLFEEARPGTGPLVLGHKYPGADKYYLSPFKALQQTLPLLAIPEAMQLRGYKRPVDPKAEVMRVLRTLDRASAATVVKDVFRALKGGAPLPKPIADTSLIESLKKLDRGEVGALLSELLATSQGAPA